MLIAALWSAFARNPQAPHANTACDGRQQDAGGGIARIQAQTHRAVDGVRGMRCRIGGVGHGSASSVSAGLSCLGVPLCYRRTKLRKYETALGTGVQDLLSTARSKPHR